MTDSTAHAVPAAARDAARILLAALAVALLLGGCTARRRPAIPWTTAVLVRPNVPQHPQGAEGAAEPAPDLKLAVPSILIPLAARSAPTRPRTPAAPNANAAAGKPDTPQIVPELSTQESASLQNETNQSLGAAERNLTAASGKSLNATQADLASKVRSFISDSREAGRAGDWARARDLAQKAQVLSEELARSL